MSTGLLHHTQARFRHYSGEGDLLWASGLGEFSIDDQPKPFELANEQPFELNFMADEGESLVLDGFWRAATIPSAFFLGLLSATPTETSTLSSVTEVTGTGYARKSLTRNSTNFPTLALVSGDFKVSMLTQTFACTSGTWSTATYAYWASTSDNTGKLIAAIALGTSRTLTGTDTLAVDYAMTAS